MRFVEKRAVLRPGPKGLSPGFALGLIFAAGHFFIVGLGIGPRLAAISFVEARFAVLFELRRFFLGAGAAEAEAIGGGARFLEGALATLFLVTPGFS